MRLVGAVVALLAFGSSASADDVVTLPVAAAVVHVDGQPVVDRTWMDERIDWANRIFAPADIAFELVDVRPLDEAHRKLESRRDRHALGAELRPRVINWFVVEALKDVDVEDRWIRGVHWRPRGYPEGSHFVIMSQIAGSTVLAHELGHFFGNRRHPDTPGNIMSYQRGDVEPFFDDTQLRRIREHRRRFLRTRELIPVE